MENYIVWIFLGFIGVFTLFSALKGLSRGIARQIIRTLTVGASAGFAVWLAKFPYHKYVVPFFDSRTTEEIIESIKGFGVIPAETDLSILYSFDSSTLKYLLSLPVALILIPVLFILIFLILKFITHIIHAIICGILGFRKSNNNAFTRLLGFALGAVQGAAVALLLLTPVIGYAAVYESTVATLTAEMPDDPTTVTLSTTYDRFVKPTAEHPVTKTAKKYGVDLLFSYLVTVNVDYTTPITMTDKVPGAAEIYAEARKLAGADWKGLNEDQEAAVKAIIAKLDEDDYFAGLVSGIVRGAAKAYTYGKLGFEIPEPFGSLASSAVSIFHTTDRTNIAGDLYTLADVYFVLSRDGVFYAFLEEDATGALLEVVSKRDPVTGNTPIKDVINTIESNPRIKPLISTLAKLSVTVMTDALGEEGAQIFESVSTGLTNTLAISKEGKTDEEYVSEVSESISKTLSENNIKIDKEIVDTMAQYVSDNDLASKEGTTAEDILITYFDAYLEYRENGTLPEGGGDLGDLGDLGDILGGEGDGTNLPKDEFEDK